MKKTLLFTLFAAAISFTSCNEDESLCTAPESSQQPEFVISRATFPEDDGSPVVPGNTLVENVARLLQNVDAYEAADTLGRANITPQQYAEIKAFADELVKGTEKQYDAFIKCYEWVSQNIKYGLSDNDPYAVFINRKAVCQGYANLLFIMLHSQGIPACVSNGFHSTIGGHAWNYVNCDGKWYVADPTNPWDGGPWSYRAFTSYSHLIPLSLDIVFYKEQGCWFDFNGGNFNLCKVTSEESAFTVPFSAAGYQVTSFNPTVPLPSSIKEIYIGKNIKSLGESLVGLSVNAPNLEYVNIDPANATFASYMGVVYRRNGSELDLLHIPLAMKCLELMPMEIIYKNTVYFHDGIEVLIVAPGTKRIEAWGVERCPNLKIAYVPEGVEIAENAFAEVHPDFQIVRGDFTNIPQVKE
ncbi:MAG: transglutaminase domain-containing protein [Bacteroidaceae bacterium]|nr:transglutaminase domain-containing protein [Bacteroidaceae bacterium]